MEPMRTHVAAQDLPSAIRMAIGRPYPEPPGVAGIYALVNLDTAKAYVGQTNHLARRGQAHFAALRAGAHHCAALQADWNALGPDRFTCIVVREMLGATAAELNAAEAACIEQVFGPGSYNQTRIPAGRPIVGRTPDNVRTARHKKALLDAGGRRLTLNLSSDAAVALEEVRKAQGLRTDRETIEYLLLRAAATVRRAA